MKHQRIKETLLASFDNELAHKDREQLTSHLKSCKECKREFENLKQAKELLIKFKMPQSSDHFVSQVMQKIDLLDCPVQVSVLTPFDFKKWLFPTLGYSFGLLLMFLAINYRSPESENAPNTEMVLLETVPQNSQWIFLKEKPDMTKLLETKEE